MKENLGALWEIVATLSTYSLYLTTEITQFKKKLFRLENAILYLH